MVVAQMIFVRDKTSKIFYKKTMQILVLGTHRSGTSLVTRLVNMMGAFFDAGTTSIGFNDENPKGFWERRDVIAANDAILAHHGATWDKLATMPMVSSPTKKDLKSLDATITAMKNIVLELDAHRPWVMKDPRLCVTMPYWKPLLEVPVAIVMYRDPLEVAMSLKTRNHFALSHSMAIWEYSFAGIVNAVRDIPTVFISHTEVIAKPVETVARLLKELEAHGVQGLHMPTGKEIEAFIEPTLYRSKLDEVDRGMVLTKHHEKLIACATGKKPIPKEDVQVSLIAKDAMEQFEQALKVDERLASANRNFSAMEQQRNELFSEVQTLRQRFSEIERITIDEKVHAAEMEKRVRDIHNSTLWKVSSVIAGVFGKKAS